MGTLLSSPLLSMSFRVLLWLRSSQEKVWAAANWANAWTLSEQRQDPGWTVQKVTKHSKHHLAPNQASCQLSPSKDNVAPTHPASVPPAVLTISKMWVPIPPSAAQMSQEQGSRLSLPRHSGELCPVALPPQHPSSPQLITGPPEPLMRFPVVSTVQS